MSRISAILNESKALGISLKDPLKEGEKVGVVSF